MLCDLVFFPRSITPLLALLLCLGGASPWGWAQSPPESPESADSVVAQAEPADSPSAFDIVDSLDQTQAALEQAVAFLQRGDVPAFLVAYGAVVRQHVECTVALRHYARRSGEASAEIDFAKATLAELLQGPPPSSADAQWKPRISEVRSVLLTEARDLRDQYERLGGSDGSESSQSARAVIGGRLQSLVDRLNHLDQWLEPAGSEPLTDNAEALSSAREQLVAMSHQQRADRQLTQLAAEMLRESISLAEREVDRGLKVLSVQAQLPRDLESRQAAMSEVVARTLDQVRHSRQTTRESIDRMAGEIAARGGDADDALIGQVDRLLGKAHPEVATRR